MPHLLYSSFNFLFKIQVKHLVSQSIFHISTNALKDEREAIKSEYHDKVFTISRTLLSISNVLLKLLKKACGGESIFNFFEYFNWLEQNVSENVQLISYIKPTETKNEFQKFDNFTHICKNFLPLHLSPQNILPTPDGLIYQKWSSDH